MKRLRRLRYGQSKRQAHALTETEEGKLWATLVVGEENPKQLLFLSSAGKTLRSEGAMNTAHYEVRQGRS